MKFKFRFASLLKVRKHKEHVERQKMGILMQEKADIVQKINKEQEKVLTAFSHQSGNSETISSIRMGYDFMHASKKKIIELQGELEKVKADIEAQQAALIEANKKVRMIELIEEKDLDEFVKEQQAQEQLQLNEVAMQIFNRTN